METARQKIVEKAFEGLWNKVGNEKTLVQSLDSFNEMYQSKFTSPLYVSPKTL